MTIDDAPAGFERSFKLFAVEQRVLAQNPDGKLIDIGALETQARKFIVRLDVDPMELKPAPSVPAALRELASKLSFDYLDGLFTSESTAHYSGQLQAYPHIAFSLDEPLPRFMTDRPPPQRF